MRRLVLLLLAGLCTSVLSADKPNVLLIRGKPHLPFCAPKKYWDLVD